MTNADLEPGVEARTCRLDVADALSLALPVALCVAHGYSLFVFSSFTPRVALLLAAGVPGLFLLARMVKGKDAAAIGGAALVVWAVITALLSDAVRLAALGVVGRESSALILALSVGVWAVGRGSSQRVVELMPYAVLVGLGANALVGVMQVVLQVESGALALQYARATGLTPNPVYFGALTAAGAALAAASPGLNSVLRLCLVAYFSAATNLSGSRVALLAGLVGIVVGIAWSSNRRQHLVSYLSPVAYVVGAAAGWLLTSVFGVSASTSRFADSGGGRLQAWEYGLEAVVERPLFGWGLGRFSAATQSRFSAEFVSGAAIDDLRQAWFDAHNVAIEFAVGTGVVGLALLLLWLLLAARNARGPLTAPTVVLGLVVLLQPAGLAILPLGLLLLGCADHVGARPTVRRLPSLPSLVALLIGVSLAGLLAIGDLRMASAVERLDPTAIVSAASWFPGDPVVADIAAQAWFIEAGFDESARPYAVEWSERAIAADPDRPYLRAQFAARLLAFGRAAEAQEQLDRALELQPWHARSWYITLALAEETDNGDLRSRAVDALCQLDQLLEECST